MRKTFTRIVLPAVGFACLSTFADRERMDLNEGWRSVCTTEAGKRFVPDYELRALAEALQTTYDYLLDGTESQT